MNFHVIRTNHRGVKKNCVEMSWPGSPHFAFQSHELSHRVEVMAMLGALMIW